MSVLLYGGGTWKTRLFIDNEQRSRFEIVELTVYKRKRQSQPSQNQRYYWGSVSNGTRLAGDGEEDRERKLAIAETAAQDARFKPNP